MITTDGLPGGRWREPGDVRAVLDLPPAGVLIGIDDQTPVALPAIGPRVTRLGVLGDHRIAMLLAYRLLGVGCLLAVATAEPGRWRRLLLAAGSRAVVGAGTADWPPRQDPADDAHLLVTDLESPPDLALGDRPQCTVVHVATAVPVGSPYWAAVDGVVLVGTGHGAALARELGRDDAWQLDGIGPGRLGVLDRHRAVGVVPILAEAERSLLLGD